MMLPHNPAGSVFPGAGDVMVIGRAARGWMLAHDGQKLLWVTHWRHRSFRQRTTAGKLGMSSSSGGMNEPGLEAPTAQSGGSFVPVWLGSSRHPPRAEVALGLFKG